MVGGGATGDSIIKTNLSNCHGSPRASSPPGRGSPPTAQAPASSPPSLPQSSLACPHIYSIQPSSCESEQSRSPYSHRGRPPTCAGSTVDMATACLDSAARSRCFRIGQKPFRPHHRRVSDPRPRGYSTSATKPPQANSSILTSELPTFIA